jgi:hypothetical protein
MESMDDGYGQYVVLDFNDTSFTIGNLEQDYYNQYNQYLDKYEHILEYDPNLYIQDNNMISPLMVFNTSLITNPIVHIITGVINWFS